MPAVVVRRGPAVIWCAVFLGLLAWRFEYLTRPPYEDLAALWLEVNFLAEHDFDYYRLWTQEPGPEQVLGGRSYLSSILPTFLAALMEVCPTPRHVFIVYHLVYLACGATVAVLILYTLRPMAGWAVAALAAAAALTTPAFSVRLEQIGMDLPMATAALAAGVMLWQRRFVAAAGLALLAFLIKPTGAIMTAACLGLVFLWLMAPAASDDARRRLRRALAMFSLLLAFEIGVILLTGVLTIDDRWNPPSYLRAPRLQSAPFWVPDVILIFLLAGLTLIAALVAWLRQQPLGRSSSIHGLLALVGRFAEQHGVAVLGWLVMSGTILAMTKVFFMPRYLTLPIPFLYLALVSLSIGELHLRKTTLAVLLAITSANLINSHGQLYPSLVDLHGEEFFRTNEFSPRASIALERSLEYRRDHEATIRVMRLLETHHAEAPIFTEDTYCVYLRLPRFGYVTRPLEAYPISDYAGTLQRYLDLSRPENEQRPIFLVGGLSGFTVKGPEPEDEILFRDREPIPLIAFRRRWPGGIPDEATREAWYFDHLCPSGRLGQPAAAEAIARARLTRGDYHRARRALRLALDRFPCHTQLLTLAAETALYEGRLDEAESLCRRVLREDLRDVHAWALYCIADLWRRARSPADPGDRDNRQLSEGTESSGSQPLPEDGGPVPPDELLRACLSGDVEAVARLLATRPSQTAKSHAGLSPDALALLPVVAYIRAGRLAEAGSRLAALQSSGNESPWARLLAVGLRLAADAPSGAVELLTHPFKENAVEAWRLVVCGRLLLGEGSYARAHDAFQAAVELDPSSADALFGLGEAELAFGRPESAQRWLEAAIEREPHFSRGINLLGVAYVRAGRPEAAAKQFARAVELDPENQPARHNLTRCVGNQGRGGARSSVGSYEAWSDRIAAPRLPPRPSRTTTASGRS